MTETPVRYILAMYGNRHLGMLLTCLYSIFQNDTQAGVTIFWQDADDRINQIRRAFPYFDFVETSHSLGTTAVQRISQKTLLWDHAAALYADGRLAFIDVDTLVLRPIGRFFDGGSDVVITDKPERFVLNSGVILVRASPRVRIFLRSWMKLTTEILSTPSLMRQANDRRFPYGGGDQMALHQLLRYEPSIKSYEVPNELGPVKVRVVPCAILNQTNSVPVAADTHIIHYKGGWQPVLLEGKTFNRHRRLEPSREMYRIYLEHYREAVAHLNRMTGSAAGLDRFGIVYPSFLDQNLNVLSAQYVCAKARELAADAPRLGGLYARAALRKLGTVLRGGDLAN